jgi:hypothetical protein
MRHSYWLAALLLISSAHEVHAEKLPVSHRATKFWGEIQDGSGRQIYIDGPSRIRFDSSEAPRFADQFRLFIGVPFQMKEYPIESFKAVWEGRASVPFPSHLASGRSALITSTFLAGAEGKTPKQIVIYFDAKSPGSYLNRANILFSWNNFEELRPFDFSSTSVAEASEIRGSIGIGNADHQVFDRMDDKEAERISTRGGEVLSEEDRRAEERSLSRMTLKEKSEYYRFRDAGIAVKDALRRAVRR